MLRDLVRSTHLFALILLALPAWGGVALASGQTAMVDFERNLERKFPSVRNLIPEDYENWAHKQPQDIAVFDVREPSEYAVSHLPAAQRVDPGISSDRFVEQFADRLKGKKVVLYCSVGYRSSALADRVQYALKAAGAEAVYNLRGGIFAWHNTGRGVVRGGTATDFIHPYSRKWSYYLDFDNLARYGKSGGTWWRW